MEKLIALIAAPAGAARAAMRQRFLEHDAPALLERSPLVRKFTVNIADIEAKVPDRKPPAYDVAVECWCDTVAEMAGSVVAELASLNSTRITHAYHVRERVQLDDGRAVRLGERSPGVKAIHLSRRVVGMSPEEAKRRWQEHAPLAVKHHAGMRKYVQNGVIAALTPGVPVVHGIAELHFPTIEDLEHRMYDSAQGQAAIAADVATLVAETTVLYASEYVLRA